MILYLVLFIILISFSAFFSGSETAFFSLSPMRLERMRLSHIPGEKRAAQMMSKPQKLLVGVLVGNMLVNVGASTIMTSLAVSTMGDKGVGLAIIIMTFLILIFGEISPKTLAVKHNVKFVSQSSMILLIILRILTPFRQLMEWCAVIFLKSLRKEEKLVIDEKDFRGLLHSDGKFTQSEKETLLRILEIDSVEVGEIKIEVKEYPNVSLDYDTKTVLNYFKKSGERSALVYLMPEKDIIGILELQDLIGKPLGDPVKKYVQTPLYFVESEKLLDVLSAMKARNKDMALILGKDNKVNGVIDVFHILDWILLEPEIEEERELQFAKIGETYLCPAHVSIDDFTRVFGLEYKIDKSITLAGFLERYLGRIPQKGEEFDVENYHFWIIKTKSSKPVLIGVRENK
ncbi:DUF21 domain-containing protein [bacterium]|nr:DUF21 domain-containing protein [bacterium]